MMGILEMKQISKSFLGVYVNEKIESLAKKVWIGSGAGDYCCSFIHRRTATCENFKGVLSSSRFTDFR